MCGRFALGIPKHRLEAVFDCAMPCGFAPSWNVAPGRESVTVAADGDGVRADMRRFGLVPHWAKDAKADSRLINARSETVFDKPAFRDAARASRCLVPVQAFYEWKKTGVGKQPYAFAVEGADVFALAGLTSRWTDAVTGEVVDSFAVLTCEPNDVVRPIHGRMPVVLPPNDWERWLDPVAGDPEQLRPFLTPFPPSAMRVWPVDSKVADPANDGARLLRFDPGPIQGKLLF